MSEDPRCCGTGNCIINADGVCWCGQAWDGEKMCMPKIMKNADLEKDKNAVLFIDEIHRFSKAQQDSLLGAVEKGIVTLIGATTENPSFEVISALLSRCQVYTLEQHSKKDLLALLNRALKEDSILQQKEITLTETNALLRISGGDARKLLNVFEIIIGTFQGQAKIEITDEVVLQNAQQSLARYDKDGEQHYDIISAFIKSIRGSDPDAAVYWLARMLVGGESLEFIGRRLLILASEDIGLANGNALLMANNCFLFLATRHLIMYFLVLRQNEFSVTRPSIFTFTKWKKSDVNQSQMVWFDSKPR